MTENPSHQTQFQPPTKGTGWPYAVLMLIGAGICAYLAVDLYLVFAGYDRTPPRDYIFVVALAGFAFAFAAGAWGFWYFPWSWAHLRADERGVDLSVRGMGAMAPVHLAWDELTAITAIVLPRHASTLTFRTGEGLNKTIRAAALEDGLDDVVVGLAKAAAQAGYEVSGPPLKAPILGKREWTVTALG